ncbi:hypothetical protein [Sorangium sp. So ce590]|uniref:hypothetical protein n=1 Tax=unclassified Sorangium TaxID=2621164 RepID=UPI003F5F8168
MSAGSIHSYRVLRGKLAIRPGEAATARSGASERVALLVCADLTPTPPARRAVRDAKAVRESIERLLDPNFDRAAIARGEPLASGAKAAAAHAFPFL